MTIKEIAEELSFPMNEQALKKLTLYNNRVIEIGKHINLTGIKTTEESLIKNVYDSLTVYEPDYFPTNSKLLDLGTGAGFPGIPLSIIREDLDVILMDSIQKKLLFIEKTALELGIKNVKIQHVRAEEAGRRRKMRETFDVVTARAVKMLPIISEWALPFVKVGGIFAAMKGPGAKDELAQSQKILHELHAEVEKIKNLTLPTGEERTILYIRKTAPCPKTYPRKIGIAEKKPILTE